MASKEKIFGQGYRLTMDLHAAMNGGFIGAGIALHEPFFIILGAGMAIQGEAVVYLYKTISRKLDKLSDDISHKLDEHEHDSVVVFQDGEPVEPDPDTATPAQIDAYMAAVREEGGIRPPNDSNNNEAPLE